MRSRVYGGGVISLRRVGPDDREFLLRLYEESRETELSMTPWNADQKRMFAAHQYDAQTRHYEKTCPNATHDLILYDGEPAGRLYVDRRDSTIAIMDINVLKSFQKKGIATALVRDLQAEAADAKQKLRIFIAEFDPSQKLFRELGFVAVPSDGVDLRFEWYAGK